MGRYLILGNGGNMGIKEAKVQVECDGCKFEEEVELEPVNEYDLELLGAPEGTKVCWSERWYILREIPDGENWHLGEGKGDLLCEECYTQMVTGWGERRSETLSAAQRNPGGV